jgi:crotonobetainyl-CoA:carnitine CoA-transferase CaiB-like acyl-CoA transferase
MSAGILSHLKVLDFTHFRAGPYCTRLLAGYGATVIKVERVGTGDPLRQQGPFVENQPGLERSIPFHWFNGNKQSITLNLKHPAALDFLRPLIETVDVLVENFMPGVMDRLGLSYDALRQINPRIVVASISNFGQTGPYRDYRAEEIVLYAMSGGMSLTGDRDHPPLASMPPIAQCTAGMHAYIGILMALHRCDSEGEHVDVSIQESALENVEVKLAEALQLGKVAKRNGDRHVLVPWECYPAADGYAAIIGGPMRRWKQAALMFEDADLLAPPMDHVIGRIQNREATEAKLKPWISSHSKMEIYHKGQEKGLAFGYLASLAEAFQSRQHEARQFFQETDPHPEVGTLKACGAPFHPSKSQWQMGRAPLLGEHNELVYGNGLHHSTKQLDQLKQEGLL